MPAVTSLRLCVLAVVVAAPVAAAAQSSDEASALEQRYEQTGEPLLLLAAATAWDRANAPTAAAATLRRLLELPGLDADLRARANDALLRVETGLPLPPIDVAEPPRGATPRQPPRVRHLGGTTETAPAPSPPPSEPLAGPCEPCECPDCPEAEPAPEPLRTPLDIRWFTIRIWAGLGMANAATGLGVLGGEISLASIYWPDFYVEVARVGGGLPYLVFGGAAIGYRLHLSERTEIQLGAHVTNILFVNASASGLEARYKSDLGWTTLELGVRFFAYPTAGAVTAGFMW